MARTHFTRLAYTAGHGVVAVCSHGLVHLTWENVTVRLERNVFQRLARLLERTLAAGSPIPAYDEDLSVRCDRSECRIAVDAIEWIVSTEDFLAFRGMIHQALGRLEDLLASGDWPAREDKAPPALSPFEDISRPTFSLN
jgi:hypothetical protein